MATPDLRAGKSDRFRRRAAAGLTAVAIAVGTSVWGASAASAGSAVAPAVAPTAASVPVMVVLDASGSMNQDDAPGPRIDAAKAAAKSLVAGLPDSAQVGLTVYGTSTGSTDAEKSAGCQDITTLLPVQTLDRPALNAAIDGVHASGYTPIGSALRAAADALPNEGPRSIVLVSDGEDTCAPPAPCDVAAELKQQGVDLTVHTVGFKVDQAARDQLACIADATGGTYSDAADSGQLETALQTKVEYAITGYQTQGIPVTGSDQLTESAPLLNPGQYLDSYATAGTYNGMDGQGTRKYYTVPVVEGSTLYVSATIVPPTQAAGDSGGDLKTLGVDLTLRAKDNYRCDAAQTTEVLSDRQQGLPTALLASHIQDWPWGDRCPTDGVVIVEVQRTGDAYAEMALPVELVVRNEPPVDTAGLPSAAEEGETLQMLPLTETRASVTGGSSFNDAPDLTSGLTYADTLVTGENRFYKIPIGWGQRFSYAIAETGPAQPELEWPSYVSVDVYNPVRDTVNMTDDTNGSKAWFGGRQNDPFSAALPYEVQYMNRDSYPQNEYALDGYYYLRVSAEYSDQRSVTSFALTVQVVGDRGPAPSYQPLGGAASNASTAASSSASSTATTTSSSSATASSSTQESPSTGSTATSTSGRTWLAGSAGPGESGPNWLVIGGAAFAVVAGTALLIVLGSRRNRSTH